MDAPITPHTVISTDIVAPHPILTTSPTGITHTTPQTKASLSPKNPNSAQDPQPPKPHCPKTVIIQDSPSDSSSYSDRDSNPFSH